MDVIMAHQHGVKTAVAGLGTAFTPDHASLMRRFADRVVLVYDADAAGRNAADRAVHVLFDAGLDCRVAVIPEGKDPCDLLVLRGPDPLRAALEGARDLFDHVASRALSSHDLRTIGGRAAATDEILGFAIRVHDDVRRSMMLEVASAKLGLPEDKVRARAMALIAASAPRTPAADAAAAARPAPRPAAASLREGSRERWLLEAALSAPGLARRLAAEAPPETFTTPSYARIARAITETAGPDGTADAAACAASLQDDVLANEVAVLASASAELGEAELARRFEECLQIHGFERRIEEARRRFHEARAHGDKDEEDRWFAELNRLQGERKRTPPSTER